MFRRFVTAVSLFALVASHLADASAHAHCSAMHDRAGQSESRPHFHWGAGEHSHHHAPAGRDGLAHEHVCSGAKCERHDSDRACDAMEVAVWSPACAACSHADADVVFLPGEAASAVRCGCERDASGGIADSAVATVQMAFASLTAPARIARPSEAPEPVHSGGKLFLKLRNLRI